MAPKKRKDPEDIEPPRASRDTLSDIGQAQPPQDSLSDEDDLRDAPPARQSSQDSDDPLIGNLPRAPASNRSDHHDDNLSNPRQETREGSTNDFDFGNMPLEDLEAELRIHELRAELRLQELQKAIRNKKRQNPQNPTKNQTRVSVSQGPASTIPLHHAQAPTDAEHILRERHNERLRRAGLFPPRAGETTSIRASVPAHTVRHPSVAASVFVTGIDKKISDIMSSTNRGRNVLYEPGEKSELSKAGIKVATPEKWKGDRSLQAFTDWTHSVAHYFKVHAPLSEHLKVDLIGGYLSGDPLDWYWRYVAPNATDWTASDVMVALRRQFLVDELSRQAADKFESADQGTRDIHAFQAYLLKLADQMAEYPSPVALNRRLLKGMKSSISSAIVATRGIDAEISPWEDIVQAAMDQERSLRYASSFSKSTNPRQDDRREPRREPPRMTPRPPTTPFPFNKPKPSVPQASGNPTNTPFARVAPPGYGRTNTAQQPRPSGAKPSDQCRACGGYGHWASECPKRLRTNAIDVEPSGDQEPEDDGDNHKPEVVYFEDENYIEPLDLSDQTTDEPQAQGDHQSDEAADKNSPSEDEDDSFFCSAVVVDIPRRESNISSAKAHKGLLESLLQHRPPLVDPPTSEIVINGVKARALFDSGSTADLISASFVDLHKIKTFPLANPLNLQLAITGSRGKINRGCRVQLTHGKCQNQVHYFDVLNLDRYDVILGTAYQKAYGVVLDVSSGDIAYKKTSDQRIADIASAAKDSYAKKHQAFGVMVSKSSKGPTPLPAVPPTGVKITTSVETTRGSASDQPVPRRIPLEPAIVSRLREEWFRNTEDLWGPRPLTLPPFREINHTIPLIDENYRPYCRPAKCPEQFKTAFLDKIEQYTTAGLWQRASTPAAMPMMVIPKADGKKIRTVVDARQRNDNTVKDVTPFPDQDAIRRDVARAKYRSKLDQRDFFEQIRIIEEDVWKTAFATPFGVFVSKVAQQGDCNVPSTAQNLVMFLFRKYLGKFIHVYLDDTFIYSDTIEEHQKHLWLVFNILRAAKLYLSKDKMDLYSTSMMCLGHVIDDRGLHADHDKLSKIVAWKELKTVKEVQRFLGLVQYLAQFFPNLAKMTGPISMLTHKNRPFEWGPLQRDCLAKLQKAASTAPILKPINPAADKSPIFVITDASSSGVGALYGQGSTWQQMRPAGFHSRKFNSAQMNYPTHEQELLAILEALMKWEDQLMGRKFTIITDHRGLEFLKSQRRLSGRQARWLEYLSKFNFDVQYIPGETNIVADYLSRFWEDPLVTPETHDFVNADSRLTDEDDAAPPNLYSAAVTRAQRSAAPHVPAVTPPALTPSSDNESPPVLDVDYGIGPAVRAGYSSDPFFQKVWSTPKDFVKTYEIRDGFLWLLKPNSRLACIPGVLFKGRRVTELIIDNAHKMLGHLGSVRTLAEVRRYYYWPTMAKDVEAFCRTCGICAVSKPSTQAPAGKLHSIKVPERIWQGIALDFVGPLPKSQGYDFLLVVICRLSSMVHLIPTVTTVTAPRCAQLVYDNIVRLHGLPESIISDQDPRWKSTFWQELHKLLGVRLLFSTAYHPQTDGATERANRTVIQILRATVQSDQKDWVSRLTAAEFAMNSQVNQSTGFSPFELAYGFNPSITPIPGVSTSSSPFQGVKEYHEQIKFNIMAAHDNIIAARTRQTVQANKRRSNTPDYHVGDKAYLSTKNLKLPSGRAQKLMPRYIGPFNIIKCFPNEDAFTLELPPELANKRIHPTFHSSLLKPFEPNDEKLFPGRDAKAFYDFGADDEEEWNVDDILAHRWNSAKLQLLVLWSTGETTWEPLEICDRLAALERYMELHGVASPADLPQNPPPTLARS